MDTNIVLRIIGVLIILIICIFIIWRKYVKIKEERELDAAIHILKNDKKKREAFYEDMRKLAENNEELAGILRDFSIL
ncbi:MAG: hypothetical protein U9N77_04325 [Thermodesulfobacteriota bacterium]|nr:hypothetical protein [Thermodesulfobacteriota bacterium]